MLKSSGVNSSSPFQDPIDFSGLVKRFRCGITAGLAPCWVEVVSSFLTLERQSGLVLSSTKAPNFFRGDFFEVVSRLLVNTLSISNIPVT
jgi:hypothetical protein